MTTVCDNLIYVKISKYSAKVGKENSFYNTGVEDPSTLGERVLINSSVVINSRKLIVTTLGSYCFGNISTIKEVIIPNTITTIKEGVFWCCSNLEKITFLPGSRVKSIDTKFLDNTVVTELNLPATLTKLSDAFVNNIPVNLVITYCGETIIDNEIFQGNVQQITIYVHEGYKSDFFGRKPVNVSNTISCPSVVYQNKYTLHCSRRYRSYSFSIYLFLYVLLTR